MGAGREGDPDAPAEVVVGEGEAAEEPEGTEEAPVAEETMTVASAAAAAFEAGDDAQAVAAATAHIAAALEVEEWAKDERGAVAVDHILYAVGFARDLALECAHAVFLAELAAELLKHVRAGGGEGEAVAHFKSRVAANAASRPARADTLPAGALRAVADFFVRGFFAHYRLHAFLYSRERELDEKTVVRHVERAMIPPAPPLASARTDAEWEEHLEAERARAEAAAAAAEAEARAAAERERLAGRTEEEVVMEKFDLKKKVQWHECRRARRARSPCHSLPPSYCFLRVWSVRPLLRFPSARRAADECACALVPRARPRSPRHWRRRWSTR